MPTPFCLVSGCPAKASYRGRCADHHRSNERSIKRAGKQVYNSKRWAMTRRKVLFLNPLCAEPDCEAIAEDVHHKVDLAEDGDPYAMDNLEALCHSHHSRHTRARQEQVHPG